MGVWVLNAMDVCGWCGRRAARVLNLRHVDTEELEIPSLSRVPISTHEHMCSITGFTEILSRLRKNHRTSIIAVK